MELATPRCLDDAGTDWATGPGLDELFKVSVKSLFLLLLGFRILAMTLVMDGKNTQQSLRISSFSLEVSISWRGEVRPVYLETWFEF